MSDMWEDMKMQKICQKACQKICQKNVRKNVKRPARKNAEILRHHKPEILSDWNVKLRSEPSIVSAPCFCRLQVGSEVPESLFFSNGGSSGTITTSQLSQCLLLDPCCLLIPYGVALLPQKLAKGLLEPAMSPMLKMRREWMVEWWPPVVLQGSLGWQMEGLSFCAYIQTSCSLHLTASNSS